MAGRKAIRFIVLLVIALVTTPVFGGENLQMTVEPSALHIGAFFNGTAVKVKGSIPADSEAIVRLVGIKSDLHLKKKGKALGVLWMNLGTVIFNDVPNVLLIYSSEQAGRYLEASNTEDVPAARLGLYQLAKMVKIEPESENRELMTRELIKLKGKDGLYAEHIGEVHYSEVRGAAKGFETRIRIPSQFTPGDYKIELYAVRDGQILAEKIQSFRVDLVGLPAFVSSLAFEHGALYGVLATVVAILAGLLMGVLFGAGKGAH